MRLPDKYSVLKQYFGYDTFRPGQEIITDSILSGRDSVGIMPTGAGKSICFQIPALLKNGITIVVSPLISLMKDQVGALVQSGVRGAYLNSSLTYKQYCKALENAKQGVYKIIYVAPERLLTDDFLEFAQNAPIDIVSVDEAHCVSQWGQDFRPGYLKIAEFIRKLPKRPVVCAFTATATSQVQNDIVRLLQLHNPQVVTTGFNRENLYFSVRKPKDKFSELLHILQNESDKCGIVYCSTRKQVEEVCERLQQKGYASTRYHAGLDEEERRKNQDDFLYDKKTIMVATNAFGMGIDKSNVSFVVHYNMPKNLESYYQEAGRAGRDGSEAQCYLLYSGKDVRLNRFLIENGNQNEELNEEECKQVREKELERLKYMTFYSTTNECLRKFILRYFGESAPATCGKCSVCCGEVESDSDKEVSYRHKVFEVKSAQKSLLLDEELLTRLKKLRLTLARRQGIPAYAVFTDATLREMSIKKPKTEQQFLSVSGVGEQKLKRYGEAFLKEISFSK